MAAPVNYSRITKKRNWVTFIIMPLILCCMLSSVFAFNPSESSILALTGLQDVMNLTNDDSSGEYIAPIEIGAVLETKLGTAKFFSLNGHNSSLEDSINHLQQLNLTNNTSSKSLEDTFWEDVMNRENQYSLISAELEKNGFTVNFSQTDIGKNITDIKELKKNAPSQLHRYIETGKKAMDFSGSYTGIKGMNVKSSYSFSTNDITNNQTNETLTELGYTLKDGSGAFEKIKFNYIIKDSDFKNLSNNELNSEDVEKLQFNARLGTNSNFTLINDAKRKIEGANVAEDYENLSVAMKLNDISNASLSGTFNRNLNFKDNKTILKADSKAEYSLGNGKIALKYVQNWETNHTDNKYKVGSQRHDINLNNLAFGALSLNGSVFQTIETNTTENTHITNNQIDLKAVYSFNNSLSITGKFTDSNANNNAHTTTYDNLLKWQATKKFNAELKYLSQENSSTGINTTADMTLNQTFSNTHKASFTVRQDTAGDDVSGERKEIAYTHIAKKYDDNSLAEITVRGGLYTLNAPQGDLDGTLMSIQLKGLKLTTNTKLTLGAYTGPQLGGGYLSYRSWGERINGNLGIWNDSDFQDYTEIGGELTHNFSAKTTVTAKAFLAEIGEEERNITDIKVTHKLSKTSFIEATQVDTCSNINPDTHLSGFKISLFEKELPAWAISSTNRVVFSNGKDLGFYKFSSWENNAPKAGITYELKQYTEDSLEVERHTSKASVMIMKNLFVHSVYDKNPPNQDDLSKTDRLSRFMIHLSTPLTANNSVYIRNTRENKAASNDFSDMYTLGYSAVFDERHKLQLELNHYHSIIESAHGEGLIYTAQYENKIADDHYLQFKFNFSPKNIAKKDVSFSNKFEVEYKLAF